MIEQYSDYGDSIWQWQQNTPMALAGSGRRARALDWVCDTSCISCMAICKRTNFIGNTQLDSTHGAYICTWADITFIHHVFSSYTCLKKWHFVTLLPNLGLHSAVPDCCAPCFHDTSQVARVGYPAATNDFVLTGRLSHQNNFCSIIKGKRG